LCSSDLTTIGAAISDSKVLLLQSGVRNGNLTLLPTWIAVDGLADAPGQVIVVFEGLEVAHRGTADFVREHLLSVFPAKTVGFKNGDDEQVPGADLLYTTPEDLIERIRQAGLDGIRAVLVAIDPGGPITDLLVALLARDLPAHDCALIIASTYAVPERYASLFRDAATMWIAGPVPSTYDVRWLNTRLTPDERPATTELFNEIAHQDLSWIAARVCETVAEQGGKTLVFAPTAGVAERCLEAVWSELQLDDSDHEPLAFVIDSDSSAGKVQEAVECQEPSVVFLCDDLRIRFSHVTNIIDLGIAFHNSDWARRIDRAEALNRWNQPEFDGTVDVWCTWEEWNALPARGERADSDSLASVAQILHHLGLRPEQLTWPASTEFVRAIRYEFHHLESGLELGNQSVAESERGASEPPPRASAQEPGVWTSAHDPWADRIGAYLATGDVEFLSGHLSSGVLRRDSDGGLTAFVGRLGILLVVDTERGPRAVRIYRTDPNFAEERFAAVASLLRGLGPSQLGWFRYAADGIRVGGDTYAVGIRPWRDGLDLARHLTARHDRRAIREIEDGLQVVYTLMRAAGVAHSNVHPGNLIVGTDGVVYLVDAEGMFAPSLRAFGLLVAPNEQFGTRMRSFDSRADDMAFARIRLGLRILVASAVDARLKEQFGWLHQAGLMRHAYLPDGWRFVAKRPWRVGGGASYIARWADELETAHTNGASVEPWPYHFSDTPVRKEIAKQTGRRPNRIVSAFDVENVRALDQRSVTLVGRVVSTRLSKDGGMAYLNLGHRSQPFVAVALQSSNSRRSVNLRDYVTSFEGQWVAVTGPVYNQPNADGGTSGRAVSIMPANVEDVCVLDTRAAASLVSADR
tara:strand:- start:2850 stop:5435 length:2586 start_codon:yes stop_codon:yes gene_type:complete